ncbi:hypothetical protein ACFXTN_043278 [Malus domestica]
MSIPKEPEQVMKLRGGSVLGKKTILKSDHFPGCQNKRLSPHIDGAPNYRQADSQHVHGVAIQQSVESRMFLTILELNKLMGSEHKFFGLTFARSRLASPQVSADVVLEDEYTVTTAIDGHKLSVNPHSALAHPGSSDLLVLDSSDSAVYAVPFPTPGSQVSESDETIIRQRRQIFR